MHAMTTSQAVTTSQAAERLDVPLSTLKAWLERLDLPLPVDSRGRRLLDDDALAVLRTVRSLRESDLGYDTIRRKLVEDGVPVGGPPPAAPAAAADVAALADQVKAAVHQALGEQTYLAQAYGEATREIGRLEERIAALQGALAAKDLELQLLRQSSPSPLGGEAGPRLPTDGMLPPSPGMSGGRARPGEGAPGTPETEPTRRAWKFW